MPKVVEDEDEGAGTDPAVPLTAEALANHQKWIATQQRGGVGGSSGSLPLQQTSGEGGGGGAAKFKTTKLFSSNAAALPDVPKNKANGWSGGGLGGASATPPAPPGNGSAGAASAGPGRRGGSPPIAGGVEDEEEDRHLRDAMIGAQIAAPVGTNELAHLGGSTGNEVAAAAGTAPGGGGESEGGGGEEGEERGGSASASGESEAEGEFKGSKGDSLTSRYLIEKEVGRGTFGRVLRCVDTKASSSAASLVSGGPQAADKAVVKVAIKVVHDAGRYYELSVIEAEILRDVNGAGGRGTSHCVALLNFFKFEGHACMVFETLGSSLYEFLKANDYIPFPLYCVQDFARQMLEALAFLHSMRLVHTDLKPENVLLCDPSFSVQTVGKKRVRIPSSSRIKLIDFGCATYDDDEHKSDLIATRQYRAPEVILGMDWSYPSDIWSVGCIVAELYCGDQLFETHSNMEHVALIERGVDKWPSSVLNKSPVKEKYFDKHNLCLWRTALDADGRRHVRAMKPLDEFVGADKDTGLLSFFRSVLCINPKKRISAQRALTKSFVRQKSRKA